VGFVCVEEPVRCGGSLRCSNCRAVLTARNNLTIKKTTMEKNWNYETKVAEIETIISRIETGELQLEEVFEQFSTAVKSLRECETFLQKQQQQVDLMIETLKDNEP